MDEILRDAPIERDVPIERDAPIEEATLIGLIHRAQAMGDPVAFDGLYLLFADRIFRFLLTRLGDVDLVEEVVAQVFLHLIEKIHKYDMAPKDNVAIFSAWLYRLAYNKMVDIIRRQRRSRQVPIEQAESVAAGQPILDEVEERIDFEQVIQKLQFLNDQQRQVILLRFVEGFSIAETAQILQKSEGAVKALQHRSLETLRRYLQR